MTSELRAVRHGRWTHRAGRLSLAWVALLVAGCDGGEGDACSSTAECSGDLECLGPSASQVCGIPATELCASDDDCLPDELCHAVADPCSPDGVGSVCRVACTDGGCGEGFRCGDLGHCEALRCDEGYACADFESCQPPSASMPVYDRDHGCRSVTCSDGGDCVDTAACVNGVCQSGPGQCIEPMAVP